MKDPIGIREICTAAFWRDICAEFLGTFMLVSVQCALPIQWNNKAALDVGSVVHIAVGMGFVVCIIVEMFGHFSGGHFNPAVTVSMVVAMKCKLIRGLFYIAIQILAGIAGAGFVWLMTPKKFAGLEGQALAATSVNGDIEQWQGFLVEVWITFMLVFTIFGATDSKRKSVFMPSIPIGFAVAMGIMTGINHSGGSMNPARSFGPAVILNKWDDQWVYWAGPIVGGLLATVIYIYFLGKIPAPKTEEEDEPIEMRPSSPNRKEIDGVRHRSNEGYDNGAYTGKNNEVL